MGEEVLILASQIRKKGNPGRFYKSSVDNKSYFHNKEAFLIKNRQKIEEKFLLTKIYKNWKKLKFRFLRENFFAISNNFIDFSVVFR